MGSDLSTAPDGEPAGPPTVDPTRPIPDDAFPDSFGEQCEADGRLRPGYERLLGALAELDLGALAESVANRLEQRGVRFGDGTFVSDPVPRLFAAAEWDALAAGLAQRTKALNRFLLDAYGAREIIGAGLIPREAIDRADGFEPDLLGRLPPHPAPAAIIGFDVVREPGGELLVLEDNVRTPSGFSYALAVREALMALLRVPGVEPRPIDPVTYELLAGVMSAAAPAGVENPSVVVLTDGPDNVAYYEHAQAAQRLDARLAVLDDLIADGERLSVRARDGRTQVVDVVYRRTNEDRVRDQHGEITPVAARLLPAWLNGNLGLVNGFGNGVADDKLVHSHVEDFIGFYLGEEPLVRSVPTRAPHTRADGEAILRGIGQLVIKPRHGHGGEGVVIGGAAEAAELAELTHALTEHPERYISQPIVSLSRHPTVIDGRLEPRHVDLRPFAFAGGADEVTLMPGGLSRVALKANALVVNSSQDGGGKDTWVLG
jgi:uncharacterized circularly permuted ATP-grasp superfamily protein